MENVFEIVKIKGLGAKECPIEEYSTGLIFRNEIDAEQEADKLWKEQTTEAERESGWCFLRYVVKVRNIK